MSQAPLREQQDAALPEDNALLAYTTLRDRILTGQLAPGAMLSQVRLARDLGISRTPLREAVRRLVEERLIVDDFNRRMRVSELHLDDLDQIYAMRFALEPIGVAATVPLLTEQGRAELAAHVDGMDRAIAELNLTLFRTEHRAFHLGLTQGAGARMGKVLADLWDHSERYRLTYLQHDYAEPDSASAERLRTSQLEHRDILTAGLAGNPTACTKALLAHLHRTVEVVFGEAADRIRPRVSDAAYRPGIADDTS